MSRESSRPSKSLAPPPELNEKEGAAGRGAGRGPQAMGPAEAARYVEAFALELSSLAKRSRLDFPAYLLDMARIEAERCGRRDGQD